MKIFLLLLAIFLPLSASAADRTYGQEFNAAKALRSTDPQGAIAGMRRSLQLSIAAGNGDYATSAGLTGAYYLYDQHQRVEAGKLSQETITAIDSIGYHPPTKNILRRTQLFGMIERGLSTEGKIGGACQANRAAAETLRGKLLPAIGDGRPITVAEIIGLAPDLRSLGWRLVEREADLLDFSGRSLEARDLLDQAMNALENDRKNGTEFDQFYIFKILTRRCELLDFLGYEKDAIDAQKSLLAARPQATNANKSVLTLRINLVRNLSQWDGPSESLLAEAREIANQLEAANAGDGAKRLLAKMELDLRKSQTALETLRNDAKRQADLGNFLESAYADRDNLIARAGTGGIESRPGIHRPSCENAWARKQAW